MQLSARLAWATALSLMPVWAMATSTTVGLMPSYFEGSFGTTGSTRIWYLPAYVDYRGTEFGFKATIPYIQVENRGALVSGGTVVGTGSNASTTESGLGDIWLKGSYTFHGQHGQPDIIPYLKIKLGTASASQGLGTGQDDVEEGVEVDWTVGARVFPFIAVGYREVGSTATYPLQNIATYEGGASVTVVPAHFLTAIFAGHQSEQPGFAPAADAIIAWNFSPPKGMGYSFYVDKGLSSGSPDYGVGVGLQNRF